MKKNIAIVAGGNSSEVVVSLKSANGLFSFMDKNRYNIYIVTLVGKEWNVIVDEKTKVTIDKNDFSFTLNTNIYSFRCHNVIITSNELRER